MSEFQYDEDYFVRYFKEKNGHAYGFQEPWLGFFAIVAARLVQQFRPKSTIDVGCAMGLLVAAMRPHGLAYGFDISEYAIRQGINFFAEHYPEIFLPPVWVQDIREQSDLRGVHDLVTCIEVVEHIPAKDVDVAIANIAALVRDGGYLVFSSDPDDEDNPSHENVQPEAYWLAKFGQHGLSKQDHFDVSYIAAHAIVLRKKA